MTTPLIAVLLFVPLSLKSISFLKTYITLCRRGNKTLGRAISFHFSAHMIAKGPIPVFEFQPQNKESVIAKPIYSWFIELNTYLPDHEYELYCDKANPARFVVKSHIELLVNVTIVAVAAFSSFWLIVTMLQ